MRGTSCADVAVVGRVHSAAAALSALVAAIGAGVLVGWVFSLPTLKSLHPSLVAMKPNTAVCLLLIGVALWLERPPARRSRPARHLGAAAALIGAATLFEYLSGAGLGIDQLLFHDTQVMTGGAPGRMAPTTAIYAVLVGLAVALPDLGLGRSRRRPAEWAAVAVGMSSLLTLLGYLYGVRSLYAIGSSPPIALHTTVALLAACLALLFARPTDGVMRVVTSASPGGILARRMLPLAVLVPTLLGWLRFQELDRGYVDVDVGLGLAILIAAHIAGFAGLILWMSSRLYRSDLARRAAEDASHAREEYLAITLDSIGDAVVATDADGKITRMNRVAEALTRFPASDAVGRAGGDVLRLLDPGTREPVAGDGDHPPGADGAASDAILSAPDGTECPVAVSRSPIRDGAGHVRGMVLVLRDQRRAEQADRSLRESEARKAAVLEASLDCIVTMDHTGSIIEFNRAAEETFGYARGEAIGRPLGDLLIPTLLRDRHRDGLERFLATGAATMLGKRIEVAAMRSNESEFPAEIAVVPIHTDGPPMFTGYIRDITERRRAAEALRASEARFRRMFESGLIGIVVAGVDGAIREANDSFLRMVGFTRESLEAGLLRWNHLIPPESNPSGTAGPGGQAGAARTWEQELVCRDGTRVPVLLGVTPLGDDETIAFALDLTERKRAEAAIRRLRRERAADAKFRALLEAAPDAMIIADREGMISLVNGRTEAMFGYRREEILGVPLERLFVHGGNLDPVLRPSGSALELCGYRRDGGEFPIEVTMSPIETDEGLLLSSSIRDLSQRREVEEGLRRAKVETEIAMGELEAFSYSVAHDLRTPLRAIDGFSSALLEDLADRLDEESRTYLARIRAATQRMGELIDALLGLARVSRAELRRQPVDLTQLARKTVAQLTAGEPERTVEFDIAEGLEAKGDPQLLRVLLENLLENAWKFSARRPNAHIEFGCARGRETVYHVRDNGAGFDMTYADKLFAPFQRLHAAAEYSGTGIGLATVQRIIRRHGGRIWAEGVVNQGATFRFTLPGDRERDRGG